MEKHGSISKGEPASIEQVAGAIDGTADESYLPAFLQWKLYSVVSDRVEDRVRFKLFKEAIDSLIRYDRFSRATIEKVQTVKTPESEERRKSELEVVYDKSIINDSSRLSYNGDLVYEGESIHRGQIADDELDQTGLTDFM